MGRAFAATIAILGCGLAASPLTRAAGLEISPEQVEIESQRLARAGLELLITRQQRIARVASRIRSSGVELCGDELSPITGIVAATWSALPMAFREAAYDTYGVDDLVRVLAVLPGSAAEAAGIRAGDTILSIDGRETHSASDLEGRDWSSLEERTLLRIERGGVIEEIAIRNEPGCSHPPELFMLDSLDAYADDGRIAISSGMLRFLESDDELAVILGHELAHVVLGHDGRGRPPEEEADRLGLHLAARAGYDVYVAAELVRRIGRESPDSLAPMPGDPHPDTSRRAVWLEAEATEIDAQRRASDP